MNRKMKFRKILMYIDMMSHGGAQQVMRNLADHFATEKIEVVLVNDFRLDENEAQYQLNKNIKRLYLRHTNSGNVVVKNFERVAALRRIVKKEMPDIVLSFLGRPNQRMLIATIGLKPKKIVSVRNDPQKEYGKSWFKRCLARSLFRLADGCVFQTEEAKRYFSHSVQNRSEVIVNPVNEQFYSVKRNLYTRDIVSIGRLEPQKNNALLIYAFADLANKYKDQNVIFYGDGSLKETLLQLVKEKHLDKRIYFAGDTDNVPNILKKCNLFVLSSDYEGMPNALMEAMAVGVPCISTDCPCGGPKELIKNGEEGLLIPTGNIEEMKKAIDTILSNEKKRVELGNKAYVKAKEFRGEKVFVLWENYFNKIME